MPDRCVIAPKFSDSCPRNIKMLIIIYITCQLLLGYLLDEEQKALPDTLFFVILY